MHTYSESVLSKATAAITLPGNKKTHTLMYSENFQTPDTAF